MTPDLAAAAGRAVAAGGLAAGFACGFLAEVAVGARWVRVASGTTGEREG